MKHKLLIIYLFFSLVSFGQMQDLAKLTDGKLIFSNTLFDSENNLYGYFYIYQIDHKNRKKLNYEYFVLDKNLNKINNGTFEGLANTAFIDPEFNDCTLMGDKLILDKLYLDHASSYRQVFLNTIQIISLSDNSVSKEKEFMNNEFVDINLDKIKSIKLSFKKTRFFISAFSNNYNSGFFVSDARNNTEISFFNSNLEKKWSYQYNDKDTLKNKHSDFRMRLLKNNTIYATDRYNDKISKVNRFNIIAIDYTTGKKRYEYELDNNKDSVFHTFEFKEIDNKLVISGFYNTNIGSFDFRSFYKGLYKIVLDENGNELEKKYHPWTDFKSMININYKGRVKKNYRLNHKKTFVFEDGSVSILNEMYKPRKNSFWFFPIVNWFTNSPSKTRDFIVLNFDRNFNLNRVDTICKEFTRNNQSDYIFSQTLKSNSGAVFFHVNNKKNEKTGKKELMLGINTLIEGNLNQELIPLYKKKEYIIQPMPAKEGYVLLREYNEKKKYHQIRLEKLNY